MAWTSVGHGGWIDIIIFNSRACRSGKRLWDTEYGRKGTPGEQGQCKRRSYCIPYITGSTLIILITFLRSWFHFHFADKETKGREHVAWSPLVKWQSRDFHLGLVQQQLHYHNSCTIYFLTFYFVSGYSRLTNNVVIVAGEQWRDSAIHTCMYLFFSKLFSHPGCHKTSIMDHFDLPTLFSNFALVMAWLWFIHTQSSVINSLTSQVTWIGIKSIINDHETEKRNWSTGKRNPWP